MYKRLFLKVQIIRLMIPTPAIELYDLQKDPNELNNLGATPSYQKLITKYTNRLQNCMKEQGDSGIDMDTKF